MAVKITKHSEKITALRFVVRYRDQETGKRMRRKFKSEAAAEMFYLQQWYSLCWREDLRSAKLIYPKLLGNPKPRFIVKYFDPASFTVKKLDFSTHTEAKRFYLLYSHDHGFGDGTVQIIRPGQPDKVKCFMCDKGYDDRGYIKGEFMCGCQSETYKVPKDSIHHANFVDV